MFLSFKTEIHFIVEDCSKVKGTEMLQFMQKVVIVGNVDKGVEIIKETLVHVHGSCLLYDFTMDGKLRK